MYQLLRFASIIVPRLPHWLMPALVKMIGLAAWLIARKARKQATINMIHVLGPEVQTTRAGRRQLRRTVQSMFQNNVRNYLELFSLPHLQLETFMRHFEQIDGIEYIEGALALGKGAILYSAHFGPFDYMVQG